MRMFFLILPVAILVAYSQIIVKWRANVSIKNAADSGILKNFLSYFSDPFIISAYASALLASFAWLYVVSKLPLTVAFPIYIGTTFVMVVFGGWYFMSETISAMKLASVMLIIVGITLGMNADA